MIMYECGSINELEKRLHVLTSEDGCIDVEKYGERWIDARVCYCNEDLCNNAELISLNFSFLGIVSFLIVYNWILA